MRILFDARSVRTAAGLQVFQGLVAGWLQDSRVRGVVAAIRDDFDRALVPHGASYAVLGKTGWLRHLWSEVGAIARAVRADIAFSPNGLQPRLDRTSVYFQDVLHFQAAFTGTCALLRSPRRGFRRAWQTAMHSKSAIGICVSSDVQLAAAGRVKMPLVMIPNGVAIDGHSWSGSDDSVFVMGGTGNRKSEETALLAWHRMPLRVRGSTRLTIGGVQPEARRLRLERAAASLGSAMAVDLRGALTRHDYLERMSAARVDVSCSRAEAFGLPVAEALTLGAPVVCSDLPAHAELVSRAGAGDLFPAGDVSGLAQALERALRAEPSRRTVDLRGPWGWAERARAHIDVYETLL